MRSSREHSWVFFAVFLLENDLLVFPIDAEMTMVVLHVSTQQQLGPNDARRGAALHYSNAIAYNSVLTLQNDRAPSFLPGQSACPCLSANCSVVFCRVDAFLLESALRAWVCFQWLGSSHYVVTLSVLYCHIVLNCCVIPEDIEHFR